MIMTNRVYYALMFAFICIVCGIAFLVNGMTDTLMSECLLVFVIGYFAIALDHCYTFVNKWLNSPLWSNNTMEAQNNPDYSTSRCEHFKEIEVNPEFKYKGCEKGIEDCNGCTIFKEREK